MLEGMRQKNFFEKPLDRGTYPKRRKKQMETETERQDTRKAMAFDLFAIIDKDPAKEKYTKEEMKRLIFGYVTTIAKSE